MRIRRKLILPPLILALGVGAFAWLQSTRDSQPPAQPSERVWRVETVTVEPRDLAPTLELHGTVEAPDQMAASAPAGGRVAEVRVREGMRVEPGQLLVAMDPADFTPRVRQAEADVADLEAQLKSARIQYRTDRQILEKEKRLLELARSAFERERSLLDRDLGSQSAVDQAREALVRQERTVAQSEATIATYPSRIRQLEARLERARAQLAEARRDLERSRVEAPFAGFVSAVEVAAGDQVQANTTLVSVYPATGLEVRALVPAPYQAEVESAVAAGRPMHARASIGGRTVELPLERLAARSDPAGVDAFFAIPASAPRIRPGALLPLRLVRPAREGAIALPYEALYGSDRVYRVVDQRMQAVTVERLGERQRADGEPQLLVASDELAAGDRVVATHLPNAVNGLRVEVVER